MINKKAQTPDLSSGEKNSILRYVFGQYGADQSMPHAHVESNWAVFPGRCDCVVMDKACGEYIFNHIARHYPSSIDKMRGGDPIMEDAFQKYYIQKWNSDIRREPSAHNLNFGNFALMKISTSLDREYMMIHPDSIRDTSLENSLIRMEQYFISHGLVPDRASVYTAQAVENVMNGALRKNNCPTEGFYTIDTVDLGNGRCYTGLMIREPRNPVPLHTKSAGMGQIVKDTSMSSTRIADLKPDQMQKLLPSVADFVKKFRNDLPNIPRKNPLKQEVEPAKVPTLKR